MSTHHPNLSASTRRESDAVTNARRRIALLAQTAGKSSADYATALNQLALLLIMQGEPEAAEPLLRDALSIRRQALGESHPEYATNLSSLGGLLWARGSLDEAEPLLRQAAEIRRATLGASHPKSVVSANSLDQLMKARRDPSRPQREPTVPRHADGLDTIPVHEQVIAKDVPPPPAPPRPSIGIQVTIPVAPQATPSSPQRRNVKGAMSTASTMPPIRVESLAMSNSEYPPQATVPPASRGEEVGASSLPPAVDGDVVAEPPKEPASSMIESQMEVCRDKFRAIAAQLEAASAAIKSEGAAPAQELSSSCLEASEDFDSLRRGALNAARELAPSQDPPDLTHLESIAQWLPGLRSIERRRASENTQKERAIALLRRVSRLKSLAGDTSSPLIACQERAGRLLTELSSEREGPASTEISSLLDGLDPLHCLFRLLDADETTDDADWADSFDVVEAEFGGEFAASCARGRVVERAGP